MSSTPEDIRTQILDLVKEYHTAKFAPKTFDPDKDLVHYAGRVFDAEEIVNLVDASLDFYLTANRYAERFESEFAEYLGLSNALLVNSGSSANLVALTSLTSSKLKGDLTNTNLIMSNTFFIGVYPGIDDKRLNHIQGVFDRFMAGERVS